MNKNLKVVLFFSVLHCILGLMGIYDELYQFFHNKYYGLTVSSCYKFNNYSPKMILEEFSLKSNYTKRQAVDFFATCNNKKSAPFMIYSLKHTKGMYNNSFSYFYPSINFHKKTFYEDEIYSHLYKFFPKSNRNIQNYNEKEIYIYWRNIIYNELNFDIYEIK